MESARGFLSTQHFLATFPQPWLLTSGSKAPQTAYLRPLGELPLGPTGLVLAGFPLHGPGQPRRFAEVIINGAVKAWSQHLPASDGAVLIALTTGPGALAPPAGLPPPRAVPRRERTKENPGKGAQGLAGKCLHAGDSPTQWVLL